MSKGKKVLAKLKSRKSLPFGGECRNQRGVISLSSVRVREQTEFTASAGKRAAKRCKEAALLTNHTGPGLTTEPLPVWDSAARSVPAERIGSACSESVGRQPAHVPFFPINHPDENDQLSRRRRRRLWRRRVGRRSSSVSE